MEEAARVANLSEPGGTYDAKALWTAALAVSRQRLAGSGRGCSQKAAAEGKAAPTAEEDDDLSKSWFGGSIDADGNFVPQGKPHAHSHRHQTAGRRGQPSKKGAQQPGNAADDADAAGCVTSGAGSSSGQGSSLWTDLTAEISSHKRLMLACVAWSAASIVWTSVRHARSK